MIEQIVWVLALSGAFLQPSAPKVEVVKPGYYRCTSELPNGKTGFGVTMVRPAKDLYVVTWVQPDGVGVVGVGFLVGDELVVGWNLGEAKGVTRYKVGKDGTLKGHYAMLPGDGAVYGETLEFLIPFGAPTDKKKE